MSILDGETIPMADSDGPGTQRAEAQESVGAPAMLPPLPTDDDLIPAAPEVAPVVDVAPLTRRERRELGSEPTIVLGRYGKAIVAALTSGLGVGLTWGYAVVASKPGPVTATEWLTAGGLFATWLSTTFGVAAVSNAARSS